MMHTLELYLKLFLPPNHPSFGSSFTELTEESRWSSSQNLEVRKHPDFQGKDSSRSLWNAITQDSRAPTIHILPCSKGTVSSTILLLLRKDLQKGDYSFFSPQPWAWLLSPCLCLWYFLPRVSKILFHLLVPYWYSITTGLWGETPLLNR